MLEEGGRIGTSSDERDADLEGRAGFFVGWGRGCESAQGEDGGEDGDLHWRMLLEATLQIVL